MIGRALTLAQSDLGKYYARNHETLALKLREVRAERAREVGPGRARRD